MYQVVTSERDKAGTSSSFFFQCLGSILGLAALIMGAMYLNDPDICPWSPLLPVFLLTYGIVSLLSPFVYCTMIKCGFCCSSTSDSTCPIWCFMAFIIVSLVGNLGIIIWGFVLLYSNPNPVTYEKYFNSTILNENYCQDSVHLVPMIISWSYTAGVAFWLSCLCCLTLLKKAY